MKNILLLFILTQFNLAVKAQDKSLSKHVVLISIDGFRPEFYLDEKWPAPNL
ncbi:MAG: putative AlkP superfamily pyrophosphatase or phosphodiesterase, partial [Psychroserpens sp.]